MKNGYEEDEALKGSVTGLSGAKSPILLCFSFAHLMPAAARDGTGVHVKSSSGAVYGIFATLQLQGTS
uniref:Uncharacterized protein n=1 Tax=Steinernema glaseri TaxID=37863 RepID=A0A1I7ZRP2_9BILA